VGRARGFFLKEGIVRGDEHIFLYRSERAQPHPGVEIPLSNALQRNIGVIV
jgi:hypothetical protein